MPRFTFTRSATRPSMSFVLLMAVLGMLLIAGGASRADVSGQALVRLACAVAGVIALLFAPRPNWSVIKVPAILALAIVAVVVCQLIPLPPALWQQLPGREVVIGSSMIIGQHPVWRPVSLSPPATANALWSLIVPAVTLYLLAGLRRDEHARLVTALIVVICLSCLVGLIQAGGSRFDNPFINEIAGYVSGTFANRNHFSLFVALGCLLVPLWTLLGRSQFKWRAALGAGLIVLFAMILLVAGSRAGILLGIGGVVLGLLAQFRRLTASLRTMERKWAVRVVAALACAMVAAIGLSLSLNRASSLERAMSLDTADDMRRQALPTVLDMIVHYFPVGSGYGSFDPVFRIAEPAALLNPSYFNHAHSDILEVVLDGGIFGLILLSIAGLLWAWASFRSWFSPDRPGASLRRVGSAIILLTFCASSVDYPARTPMIMALLAISATWLLGRLPAPEEKAQSLVTGEQHR